MSLSLNGIKSTGMHPKVQRPAKWRRGGCDRERTETSGSLFEIGNLGFKVECLREAKLQVHAIGARDAMLAPLRYVLGCATKQRSNECVATDPV